MSTIRSVVLGAGGYLPEKVLSNDDLSRMVETSDEWIRQRTGIRERHVAADGEFTSDLGLHAARAALDSAGRQNDEEMRAGRDLVEDNRVEFASINAFYIHKHIVAVIAQVLKDRTCDERAHAATVADEDRVFGHHVILLMTRRPTYYDLVVHPTSSSNFR